ncbi:ParB/RepB/Spo0J family partition protein [bacterium]|nr:ParB/RepB/Spo0J family partition protein [bacterium]
MKATDRLASQFGNTMMESLGHRDPQAITPSTPKVVAMADQSTGRRMLREAAHIEIERITPDPNQPRKTFTEENLTSLAESLKSRGQLQPIRVRWSQDLGKFVIISGERRYRAATLAQLKTLACVVVEGELTETELRIDQLVENLLREDLKPVESARSYKELMGLNGWTVQQLADSLKIGKGTVSKALALLDLPDDIQHQVESGAIPASAAYELAKLPTADAQRELAARIVAEGLKRDEVTAAVGEANGKKPRKVQEPTGEEKPKATVTKREFEVGNAKVVIIWHKKTVRQRDIIAALEAALAEARGPAEEAAAEPAA